MWNEAERHIVGHHFEFWVVLSNFESFSEMETIENISKISVACLRSWKWQQLIRKTWISRDFKRHFSAFLETFLVAVLRTEINDYLSWEWRQRDAQNWTHKDWIHFEAFGNSVFHHTSKGDPCFQEVLLHMPNNCTEVTWWFLLR